MPASFSTHLSRLRYVNRHLVGGELIFERGDPVAAVFLIESGEVHLMRRQPDGTEFILQRASAGDLLAEASITTEAYHCGAVAVRPSGLAVFSRRDVRALIAEDSGAAAAFVTHLSREVRAARMRAEIVSLKRVRERLDAWLAWHDDRLPDKGKWRQIAGEIGVSPEALYRELARRR